MLIEASTILEKPVITSDAEGEVGRVSDIIIDPKNCKVIAFSVSGFLSKPKVISEIDVLEVTKDAIIINSEDALTLPSEIVKVKEISDKKIKVLGSQAVTETKRALGRIEDFLIDTETVSIVKFYIRGGLLSPSLVLPSEKVVKIEKGRIIFEDSVLEGGKATSAVPA